MLCIFVLNLSMEQDFEGLRKKLDKFSFPNIYLFKFIVKSDVKKIAQIEALFNSDNAQIRLTESSKGNFVSFNVKEIMLSSDEIINIYIQSSKIEGVIAL